MGVNNAVVGASRLEEARRLFADGKVVAARKMLESAMGMLPSVVLHELGRTYDPFYLGQLERIDGGSEPNRAAAFYREAVMHGSADAGADLDRLRLWHQGAR